jgi:hypothetical protein
MRAVGMLEAFELAEEVGDKAFSMDELLFMADARKRKGCKMIKSTLTADERRRVMNLGLKCKEWKERNL